MKDKWKGRTDEGNGIREDERVDGKGREGWRKGGRVEKLWYRTDMMLEGGDEDAAVRKMWMR